MPLRSSPGDNETLSQKKKERKVFPMWTNVLHEIINWLFIDDDDSHQHLVNICYWQVYC